MLTLRDKVNLYWSKKMSKTVLLFLSIRYWTLIYSVFAVAQTFQAVDLNGRVRGKRPGELAYIDGCSHADVRNVCLALL